MNEQPFALKGTFLDTPSAGELRVREGYLICLEGKFGGFSRQLPEKYTGIPIVDFTGKLILPGMTDLHLHAPQYGYAGTAMDLTLLDWLEKYTFREESRYADPEYARKAYGIFVDDLKSTSTTRACIFATLHTDATLILMKLLKEAGLGACVGKLNMDRCSPDEYREASASESLRETRRWLDALPADPLVRPILTPRFTPSCSDECMRGLGEIAKEYGLPVQSHLDENRDEIRWVASLCPDAVHYADTYDRFGLLGTNGPCIMAHCIYCKPEENRLLKEHSVMIAHCPTSNENVVAGIAPAAAYLRGGWKIGLGSDVAGGHTLDLFRVMAAAVQVSKLRNLLIDPAVKPLSIAEAFYMATKGGGAFFGKVGSFEETYECDAVVIDDSCLRSAMELTPEERLERWCYRGTGCVAAKYVAGHRVL